jgi:hypothetical protein
MGGGYSTHGRDAKCLQYFSLKQSREKRPLGRPKRRWEDNIKTDLNSSARKWTRLIWPSVGIRSGLV